MSASAKPLLPIVVLISGRGSNMLAIARAALSGALPVRIAAVISNRADAPGLQSARELGLNCQVISSTPGMDRGTYDAALADAIRAHAPGLIVLAGFMRILTPSFVREFAGRLINIHPSLLPAHRGLHTHNRVIAARDPHHGCTVHFVTEELDGGPGIIQARIAVMPQDTPETLSARVQLQEHKIYPTAIEWFATARLQWKDGTAILNGAKLDQPVIIEEQT